MKPIKVALTTLGCKVNQDETAGMQVLFENAGYEVTDFRSLADVYVVNTCTVTHLGSKKSRQLLRQARRRNPDGLVVAAGCYPQASPDELAILPEVDLIIGNSHKSEIVNLVNAAMAGIKEKRVIVEVPEDFRDLPVSQFESRHRATLKIQEGCQRFCTYCIVPKARGTLRSMPISKILSKARDLVAMGFQELVLTGINLTSYGKEQNGPNLADVVNSLAPQVNPARIRISSVEPTDFSPQLIDSIKKNRNVCRDFHIPLQSGSNSVLTRMGRKYSSEDYLRLVNMVKACFDRPSFSTDVIVGFPGETEGEFAETANLITEVGFCRLHVFKYSPRPGTPAAAYPNQVIPSIASARSVLLIQEGKRLAEGYAEQLLGCQEELLIEEASSIRQGHMTGYGERYMRLHCQTDAVPGQIITVQITGRIAGDLLAVQV